MKEFASKLLFRVKSTEKFENADALLVTDPYNMRHLSGFRGGEGALFITEEACVLITDSRYTEAAEKESDFTVVEENRENRRSAILQKLIAEHHVSGVVFEDRFMTYGAVMDLQKKPGSQLTWIPAGDMLDRTRRIKSEEEIQLIAKAEAIGDAAFSDLLRVMKTGMTELEVAAELEYQMKKHGAASLSFETIAASGPNSSMPHAVPTDRAIQNGDFLTLDFGCRYEGYCSDMTRTVAFGDIDSRQKEIYDTVLRAQLAGIEAVRPGISGAEADRAARRIIEEAGYGAYFGHSLGHSVGLYIHEDPRLAPGSEDILEPGMTVTVEPGIYIPDFCGVRIEDLVAVTGDGCKNLAASPKELVIL